MGPIVCFQFGALSMVMPSTKQPPGQRMNAGLRSAMYCAISFRKPLLRFLNVCCGNSDTKSTHSMPVLSKANTNFAFLQEAVAVSTVLYFFHDALPFTAISCFART